MSAQTGRDFYIVANNSIVAGCQETGVVYDNSPVDISTRTDGGFRKLADFAGNRKLDLNVSGIWTSDTVRDHILSTTLDSDGQYKFDNTYPVLITWADQQITTFSHDAALGKINVFTNYEETGAHDGAVAFTCNIQISLFGTGVWT